MDIDKLFKTPKLPPGAGSSSSSKRRMPELPTPEMLKRLRTEEVTNGSHRPVDDVKGKGKSRAVSLRDEEDEEEYERSAGVGVGDDGGGDEEEDEEGGRFFGGGLTDEQREILNIFDKAQGGREGVALDVQDGDDLNIAGIRRLLLKFERAIDKNQAQRSKYPNDPSKFIDSEADLDAAIKSLFPLSQAPMLAYPELVKSGMVVKLVELLTHENVDIVIDVVELIKELTDEDVGNEADDEEEDEEEGSREKGMKLLVDGLLENTVLELLVSNLTRMNESEESDRQGVYNTLNVFENILAFNPAISRTLVNNTSVLKWLLERVQAKAHDDNRVYPSELLAIILQDNRQNRLDLGKAGGVDTLLQVLSQYRKKDPVDADEVEFMENIFDSLCSSLAEPEIKSMFLEGEGVELMVIMMKEKMLARSRSIKVLDFAMQGTAGTACCEMFVEALGLKTLFSAFMGKAKKQKNPLATTPASEDATHILGIISSLFSNIPSESTARVRLLTKFVESDYEKVDRLLEIRESAEARLAVTNKEIEQERREMIADGEEVGPEDEDRWYLRKVDGGLFTLQTADYILGWVCMEDDGVRSHVQLILGRKGKSLKDIVKVLKDFHENVSDEPTGVPPGSDDAMDTTDGPSSKSAETSSGLSQKAILEGLISFLETC
ncbi:hypothetical protein FRB90_012839 [Tulasnella sp. 427]|nr:hypothetical protein FRB90_012839 [Tulasnella sp. 427]